MTETVAIRVKKETAERLKYLREKLGLRSIDDVVWSLLKSERKTVLERSFGVDRGRIKPFKEADRDVGS